MTLQLLKSHLHLSPSEPDNMTGEESHFHSKSQPRSLFTLRNSEKISAVFSHKYQDAQLSNPEASPVQGLPHPTAVAQFVFRACARGPHLLPRSRATSTRCGQASPPGPFTGDYNCRGDAVAARISPAARSPLTAAASLRQPRITP